MDLGYCNGRWRFRRHGLIWEAMNVPIKLTAASQQVFGPECCVYGVSLAETTGTAQAEARLRSGSNTNGSLALDYTLGINESARDMWDFPGWPFDGGVYLEVASGSVRGALAVAYPVALWEEG